MKAITLWQPWASLLACGAKHYETRSWATSYRGQLAIHAAKTFPQEELELCYIEPFKSSLSKNGLINPVSDLPRGAVIAIATLTDCIQITEPFLQSLIGSKEYSFGDFEVGKFAWVLDNRRQIKPVPATGRQRLWNWELPSPQ